MKMALDSAVSVSSFEQELNHQAFSCLINATLGNAAKLTFWKLWLRCGGEPGMIRRITKRELSLGRGNVNRHLTELDKAGFIDIFRYQSGKRDPDLQRPGDMRILVFFPAVDHPPTVDEKLARRRNSDQRLFPFMEDDVDSERVGAKSLPRVAQKKPRPKEVAQKAHPVKYVSHKGGRKKPTLPTKVPIRRPSSLQFVSFVGPPIDVSLDQGCHSIVADMNMDFGGTVVRSRTRTRKACMVRAGCAEKAHPAENIPTEGRLKKPTPADDNKQPVVPSKVKKTDAEPDKQSSEPITVPVACAGESNQGWAEKAHPAKNVPTEGRLKKPTPATVTGGQMQNRVTTAPEPKAKVIHKPLDLSQFKNFCRGLNEPEPGQVPTPERAQKPVQNQEANAVENGGPKTPTLTTCEDEKTSKIAKPYNISNIQISNTQFRKLIFSQILQIPQIKNENYDLQNDYQLGDTEHLERLKLRIRAAATIENFFSTVGKGFPQESKYIPDMIAALLLDKRLPLRGEKGWHRLRARAKTRDSPGAYIQTVLKDWLGENLLTEYRDAAVERYRSQNGYYR